MSIEHQKFAKFDNFMNLGDGVAFLDYCFDKGQSAVINWKR